MAVRSEPLEGGVRIRRRSGMNLYKIAAAVAQLLSYLTTLWGVEWVWPDGQPMYRYVVALLIEVSLLAMKKALFDGDGENDAVGWAGFVIDSITNLGGALPRASLVVTFPPFAVVLQAVGLYRGATATMAVVQHPISYGGFIIAIIGAILLAVAPHKLWQRGDR